jgi:peroxiredoxin
MKVKRRSDRENYNYEPPKKPVSKPAIPKARRKRQANIPVLISIIMSIALIAVIVLIVALPKSNTSTNEPKKIGDHQFSQKAKDFTLNDTDGKTHKLSNYTGVPVILDFTASWCNPCRMQAPALRKLYEEFKDRVQFLAVTGINESQTVEKAVEFKTEEGMEWPMLMDMDGSIHKMYDASGIPRIVLLDRDGIQYHVQTGNKGEMCYTEFKQALGEIFERDK